MFSTLSDRTKSCENLRITSQPIDCSSLVAKSLRLPSSSPFLLTPPQTPCLGKQTCSATLSDEQSTEHAPLNTTNVVGCCASTLPLPPPVWASETREPVKRASLCGLFGLPTPSPSPRKDSPSWLSISESRTNSSPPSRFVVQDGTPPRFRKSSSPAALLECRQASPTPDTRRPPRLSPPTHGIDGSPECPEPEVFSRTTSSGSGQQGVSSSDEIRLGIKEDNTSSDDNENPVNAYRSTGPGSISPQDFTLQPPSSTAFDERRLSLQCSPERQPLRLEKQVVDKITQSTVPRRWPSALLQKAPRVPFRHGIRTADRFIPSRDFRTQPRENFLLATPPERLCYAEKKHRRQSPVVDPFGRSTRIIGRRSDPRSGLREATLAQQNMTNSFGPTRVHINGHLNGSHRVMSQGAV